MVHSLYNLLYTPLFFSLLSIKPDKGAPTEGLKYRRYLWQQRTTVDVPRPLTIFNFNQLLLSEWGNSGFVDTWYRISDDGGGLFLFNNQCHQRLHLEVSLLDLISCQNFSCCLICRSELIIQRRLYRNSCMGYAQFSNLQLLFHNILH